MEKKTDLDSRNRTRFIFLAGKFIFLAGTINTMPTVIIPWLASNG